MSPLQCEPAKEAGIVFLQKEEILDPMSTHQPLSLNLSDSPHNSLSPVDQYQAKSWKPNRKVAALRQSSSAFPFLETTGGGRHDHTYKFIVAEKVDYNDGGLCFQVFFLPINNELVKQK